MIDIAVVDPLLVVAWQEMRSRGMTQKVLASEVGISEKHLSQLFHGKTRPSLPMLRLILAVVGLELVARPVQR